MTTSKERNILRNLAKRVAEAAALPVMEKRRELWRRHNRLERVRPLVLIFPEGSWRELLPESSLQCEGKMERQRERELRMCLYEHERFRTDRPVEKDRTVGKAIIGTGWGLEPEKIPSPTQQGAWAFKPVIHSLADLDKLTMPKVHVDDEASQKRLTWEQDLFGDILNVKVGTKAHVSFHLMSIYTKLRGLDEVMLDMYDNPEMLHKAMSILEAGHQGLTKQYEELGLLSLNNDGTYHSSGGLGYSTELPKPGFNAAHVRPCDMWSSAEAQELALVSPSMHEEFVLQYERRLLAPFGLNGYGCCEDLSQKLEYVFKIPNLRRISISPFSDVRKCAEPIGKRAIFSWKPHPAHLVGKFDENGIRHYLRDALEATRDNVVELILKDTHTCENHPERFERWSQIAAELAEEF
jgi:hypothetical protein